MSRRRENLDPETAALFERAKAGEWLTRAQTSLIMESVHPGFTFRYFPAGRVEYQPLSGDVDAKFAAARAMVAQSCQDQGAHWRLVGRSEPVLAKDEKIVVICMREGPLYHWAVVLDGRTLAEGFQADIEAAVFEAGEAFIWEHRQREYVHPVDAIREAEEHLAAEAELRRRAGRRRRPRAQQQGKERQP